MAEIIVRDPYDAPEVRKAQKAYDDLLAQWQKHRDEGTERSSEALKVFREKAKAMEAVREAIRSVNRRGKRSLQEEYVRKFDRETPVKIGDKTTTLQAHHADRLNVSV